MRCSSVSVFGVVSLSLLSLARPALGQAPAAPAAPAAAPVAPAVAPVAPAAAPSIRTDPRGVTGVSPAWQAIVKGDGAAMRRDFDAALATYREALAKDPNHAMLHYRIGQVQLLKGELTEAEAAYQIALRLALDDATLKAKIMFCLADLAERQKAFDAALSRWTEYETHARLYPKGKTYPEAAAERKKRISEWVRHVKDAAESKIRIDSRRKEAEEPTKKNAK